MDGGHRWKLAQELSAGSGVPRSGWGRDRGGHRRPGHGALAQGTRATTAKELVQFTRGEHQQKAFADGLGRAAFRAVELARGKGSKLLRHAQLMFLIPGRKSNEAPGCENRRTHPATAPRRSGLRPGRILEADGYPGAQARAPNLEPNGALISVGLQLTRASARRGSPGFPGMGSSLLRSHDRAGPGDAGHWRQSG